MGIQLTSAVDHNLASNRLFPSRFCIPVSIVCYTVNMLFRPSLVFLFCPPFPAVSVSVLKPHLLDGSFPYPPNSAFLYIHQLPCLPYPQPPPPLSACCSPLCCVLSAEQCVFTDVSAPYSHQSFEMEKKKTLMKT